MRTLRHYHQVGVLLEPARGSNGYRDYTVLDLVRLLRIKRLAALGIPLEKMPAMLDGEPQNQDDLLDLLDHDLDVEIERLRAQQSLIRLIRVNEAAPDFPPELARFFALFSTSSSAAISRMDREQAILLAHLVGNDGVQRLAEVYEVVADSVDRVDLTHFTREFEDLPADAEGGVVNSLVDRFVAALAPLLADLAGVEDLPLDEKRAFALLGEHQASTLNAAQSIAIARLIARLA